MTNTQAVFLAAWRIAQLAEQGILVYISIGNVTIGRIAAVKAWASERSREVSKLGREMIGGNGILTDHYCIKAVCDSEAIYTYEVEM